jgi:hypothetical protein
VRIPLALRTRDELPTGLPAQDTAVVETAAA